jgi:hypothetical protein
LRSEFEIERETWSQVAVGMKIEHGNNAGNNIHTAYAGFGTVRSFPLSA